MRRLATFHIDTDLTDKQRIIPHRWAAGSDQENLVIGEFPLSVLQASASAVPRPPHHPGGGQGRRR
jgi:hypothetical protein